jgi:ferredoxin
MADDDVADLLACISRVDHKVIELLCNLHPHPDLGLDSESTGIRVQGCLAGLGTGAYLMLSALGLDRILPRADACNACKWKALGLQISRQTERANRFLFKWGRGDSVTCVVDISSPVMRTYIDAKNPPLSRRDVFRLIAREGQVAVARAMEKDVSTSSHKPGRDRLRLLSSVPHLTAKSASADITTAVETQYDNLHDLGFSTITISDKCTACGVCERACPTQAIHFTKDEDEMLFSISFSPQHCIGCDSCDHVCLPDAIAINHSPTYEQVFGVNELLIVASGKLVRCKRCKSLMAARENVELCTLCEYRRAHPFSSMVPKKVAKRSHS